ncbi:MAG TPA: phospholipase C, phosphocholine-specific [Methylomirabilota bacterium]|nr:phospholipase C, phosphocholine-specific [Methylomirabilota bacterium]
MRSATRREFLTAIGAGGAVAALPPAIRRALAAPAQGGSLSSIAHVIIFSQENRSFDHIFGSLAGVQGFGDRHPLLLPSGKTVFHQPKLGGERLPWPLRTFSTSGQCVHDVDHSWRTGHKARDDGRDDGWVKAKGEFTMAYFQRRDLPYHYALAEAFTLCDAYFCPVIGPTDPNRLFLMTGTNDPRGLNGGPVIDNSEPPMSWTTYAERLQASGVSWRVYQEVDNFDDNALAWFTQFQNLPPDSPLFINGIMPRTPADFAQDVMNDRLPAVSWIISPAHLSEHPPFAPDAGADYVNTFLSALTANPQVWQKSVFILTYDEDGGFFDHVLPPTPPPGTPDEFVDGLPIGLGGRIPTFICSPWTRGGWACSEVFDHTSTLRFLERWTGVQEPNISAWRRAVCGDLTSAFDFSTTDNSLPVLPFTPTLATLAEKQCDTLPKPMPPNVQREPTQETGSKPQRPLPYRLAIRARQLHDSGQLTIALANTGVRTAMLAIHADNFRSDGPWFAQVDPGGEVEQTFTQPLLALGRYDFSTHGPNQFFARFGGNLRPTTFKGNPEPEVDADTSQAANGTLGLTFINTGVAIAVTFRVTKQNEPAGSGNPRRWTINVPAGATQAFVFPTIDGWYDYLVTLDGSDLFRREFAGHLETGAPSIVASL